MGIRRWEMKFDKDIGIKVFKKIQEEELKKLNSISFGEYLYSYHFGVPNFPWAECSKEYRNSIERSGRDIIEEVKRRLNE
jgi:hypothetical protein